MSDRRDQLQHGMLMRRIVSSATMGSQKTCLGARRLSRPQNAGSQFLRRRRTDYCPLQKYGCPMDCARNRFGHDPHGENCSGQCTPRQSLRHALSSRLDWSCLESGQYDGTLPATIYCVGSLSGVKLIVEQWGIIVGEKSTTTCLVLGRALKRRPEDFKRLHSKRALYNDALVDNGLRAGQWRRSASVGTTALGSQGEKRDPKWNNSGK